MTSAKAQAAGGPGCAGTYQERTMLARLLHALNQPLTGLQCALELAVAGPKSTEQYAHTLREGLGLTTRMRLLVEALRELADQKPSTTQEIAPLLMDGLLLAACDELQPIADEKGAHFRVVAASPLLVQADRNRMQAILFRVLESALTLCQKHTELQVLVAAEGGAAFLIFSWTQGTPPDYSPFSRPELGLLMAQAEWEQAGGKWDVDKQDATYTYTLRMPMLPIPLSAKQGDQK